MQAIETKYLPPTNTKGSKIKASCERGSIVLDWPHEMSGDDCHIYAADVLCQKFAAEDAKRNNQPMEKSPWAAPRLCGGLAKSCVHVFQTIFAKDALPRPEILPCVSRSRFVATLNDTQQALLREAGLKFPDTNYHYSITELLAFNGITHDSKLRDALSMAEGTIQRLAPNGSRATQGTRDVIKAALEGTK